MLELITAVYRHDYAAMLACATLSRSLNPIKPLNFALLYRNEAGAFSLVESVDLAEFGINKILPDSFWKSLANLLITPPHPESPELEEAIAERLLSIGIEKEFREAFLKDVPCGGAAFLMLLEDPGIREKVLSVIRCFGGHDRCVRLPENRRMSWEEKLS